MLAVTPQNEATHVEASSTLANACIEMQSLSQLMWGDLTALSEHDGFGVDGSAHASVHLVALNFSTQSDAQINFSDHADPENSLNDVEEWFAHQANIERMHDVTLLAGLWLAPHGYTIRDMEEVD